MTFELSKKENKQFFFTFLYSGNSVGSKIVVQADFQRITLSLSLESNIIYSIIVNEIMKSKSCPCIVCVFHQIKKTEYQMRIIMANIDKYIPIINYYIIFK